MPEVYLPLEVDFDEDEKVARLARFTKAGEARALRDLLVAMWRYCKRNRTDGHVPIEQVGKLVYPDSPRIGQRDADRLVDVGLAERTDDGYFFPQYLKRNKSREQLDAEAKVKAEAGRKGGKRSGELRRVEADSQARPPAETKQPASHSLRTSEARDRDRDRELLGPDEPADVTPLRARNELWDAVVEVCGIDPSAITEAGRGHIATAVKQLKAVDATPAQITLRARNYREQYRDANLTPMALTKHWASLGNDHRPPAGDRPQDIMAALSRPRNPS